MTSPLDLIADQVLARSDYARAERCLRETFRMGVRDEIGGTDEWVHFVNGSLNKAYAAGREAGAKVIACPAAAGAHAGGF